MIRCQRHDSSCITISRLFEWQVRAWFHQITVSKVFFSLCRISSSGKSQDIFQENKRNQKPKKASKSIIHFRYSSVYVKWQIFHWIFLTHISRAKRSKFTGENVRPSLYPFISNQKYLRASNIILICRKFSSHPSGTIMKTAHKISTQLPYGK